LLKTEQMPNKSIILVITLMLLTAVGCRVKKASFPLDASQFTMQYYLYENRSDRRYYNQEIEVKGILSQVTRDKDKRLVVILAQRRAPYGVKCIFKPTESIQKKPLELNSLVTVKGICKGLDEHVVLVNCSFEER
jgi:hypothetical protein